jgi:hypothetical protein
MRRQGQKIGVIWCAVKKEENAEKTMCGKIFQLVPLKRYNN